MIRNGKMLNKKINYEYFKLAKEVLLLFNSEIIREKKSIKSPKKILVVNTCIIGEFMVSLPALNSFIKENNYKIDLMVSPSLKTLAEKIRGVKKVYVAKSVYSRAIETSKNDLKQTFEKYDLIVIMRLSKESLNIIKKIKAKEVKTSFIPYVKYALHLTKNIYINRKKKQWREINFEMLGLKNKDVRFEEIFRFNTKDYKKVKDLRELKTKEKKVIIHTGSGWSTKLWDNKKWIKFIKMANSIGNFRFIFIGGRDEREDFELIKKSLNFKVYSLIERIDLKDLMILMRMSDFFIGIDSGPRNMAHLAELRSISLLGPGPKMYMPTNPKDIVIDKSNCRCTHLFCYKKETCMNKISVDDVFNAFKKLTTEKR